MSKKPEMIEVPNLLIGKVSYGRDGVDAEALEKIDNQMMDMKGDYVKWAADDLKKIQDAYDSAIALPPPERAPAVKKMFGVAHDIRGQGGSFGYPLMTEISNQLCHFIERRSTFGASEMEVMKLHLDALRLVLGKHMEGNGGAEGSRLVEGLAGIVSKLAK